MPEAEKPKRPWAGKVTKGVVYALLSGTAFYLMGGVAQPYVPFVTALSVGAVGALGAFALSVFPSAE